MFNIICLQDKDRYNKQHSIKPMTQLHFFKILSLKKKFILLKIPISVAWKEMYIFLEFMCHLAPKKDI